MVKASDYLAHYLDSRGVTCVFELVGGMITHLLDSLYTQGRIRIVSMHHEQGAAFAAEGYARMSGVPGVAMATSGPGATNLVTAIGSCYFDSTPAVFITGQVNRNEMRGNRPIRQMGFQETDIAAVVGPLTKAALRVGSMEELPGLLQEAFDLALGGRPGPVLIDIPMDVQRAELKPPEPPLAVAPAPHPVEPAFLEELLSALARAERPLVLAGGGVRSGRAGPGVQALVERLGIPVVHSLMAVDILPYDHPLRVGMIGSYGNRWANLAIGRSDLLLVLGSRLDIRQTGALTKAFKGEREVFHVDCDPAELNNRLTGCRTLQADLSVFVAAMCAALEPSTLSDRSAWVEQVSRLRMQWPDTRELGDVEGINPNLLMHQISAASGAAAAYVADVGQHQMWAAQSLQLAEGQRFLTSGGMGSMGFGLPAAIGACCAVPGRPVVLVAGDGGFQTNIQELQTVFRNGLPLKMVILNNRSHGMVRQFQQSYFDSRFQSTMWGYSAPDFAAVASAYGIPAFSVERPEGVERALARLWEDPGAPGLLEVAISPEANVYPKIAFGHPITEMEPFVAPVPMGEGMEGT